MQISHPLINQNNAISRQNARHANQRPFKNPTERRVLGPSPSNLIGIRKDPEADDIIEPQFV